jgi:integrase
LDSENHSTTLHPHIGGRNSLTRHGLKFIRLHDLRHSAATILIQNDVSMKAIQERLGHSKHQTTPDLYAHVAHSVSRTAADKLDKLNPRLNNSSTIRQQG